MNIRTQGGFSMIEILITIAILVIGLLGLAGLQTRVSTAEFEAYQRSQALVILQDIAERMNSNKRNLAQYVKNDIGVSGALEDCTGKTGAAYDLCQVNNELVGATEKSAGANLGAMVGGRACVTTTPTPGYYIVTVAWQGLVPTSVPPEDCGKGGYGNDKLRRTVSLPVRIACLTCP